METFKFLFFFVSIEHQKSAIEQKAYQKFIVSRNKISFYHILRKFTYTLLPHIRI